MTLSSYVEAVKQVEVLFAEGIGWLVFGEAERARDSLWGCLVILAGAALINLPG